MADVPSALAPEPPHDRRPVVVPGAPGFREGDQELPGPPPVRWGVLGATSTVACEAVMPALAASPKARLVATASLSHPHDDHGAFGAFGAERHYGSYDELLADDAVEAVYVPLPNSLHAAWTIKAAAAGKHVLCEKPLATSSAEADAMAGACDAAGVLLMEAYMTPFHPRSTAIGDTLARGALGEHRFASTSFTFPLDDRDNHRWRPEMGGGALLDLGIYCLAPLLAAASRPPVDVAAAAVLTESGVDASFSGWLDFGHGLTGTFSCSFEGPPRQRLEIVGTAAALVVDRAFTPGPGDRVVTLIHGNGAVEELESRGGDPYRGMVDHFSTVVRGGSGLRRPPARSMELLGLLAILRAAAERR